MGDLRATIGARPVLAWLAILLALGVRLLVPAGYMPAQAGGRTVLAPCTGHGAMAMPMRGGHRHDEDERAHDAPCGYGALALAATGGADPVPALAAPQFAAVRAIDRYGQATVEPSRRLRPPLRAPPAATGPR